MNFEDLTEEQKAKARACTTTEELVALAKPRAWSFPTSSWRE